MGETDADRWEPPLNDKGSEGDVLMSEQESALVHWVCPERAYLKGTVRNVYSSNILFNKENWCPVPLQVSGKKQKRKQKPPKIVLLGPTFFSGDAAFLNRRSSSATPH
jgi:hypothetical protein